METIANTNNQTHSEVNSHEVWFDAFINDINLQITADKNELARGDASKKTRDFYTSLINGDTLQTMSMVRNETSNALIKHIIVGYIENLKEKQINPLKLAFDLSDNKVLAWAEIRDNDEATEMSLIEVESIINGQFFDKTKIYLDSIIVEESDKLIVPPHYRPIQFELSK